MAIYDSTSSAGFFHLLVTSLLPKKYTTSQRGRLTSSQIMNRSRPPSSSGLSLGSTSLGWTACVGLSLILIHYVGTQRETALTKTSDESLSEHSEMANPLYQFVFEQLSRLREYFIAARNGEDYDSDEDLDGESLVVHQGSCHCGSVAFEVSAPVVLKVEELSGKLNYPSVRVPESSFRLLRGEELWQTYHVPDERTSATQAFSFCQKCAVHLVHAIDSDPFNLSFNVNCLTTPWKKARTRALGPFTSRRGSKSKKSSTPAGNAVHREIVTNTQIRATPMSSTSLTTPTLSREPSPISFDSKLTDSPTPPPQQFVEPQMPLPFSNRNDSLSVSSHNFNPFNYEYATPDRDLRVDVHEPEDSGPYVIKGRPHVRTASSLSTTEALSTDASSLHHPDGDHSLYGSSSVGARGSPTTPTVDGRRRSGSLEISSNYALREKLRSHMSKHMKTAQSS